MCSIVEFEPEYQEKVLEFLEKCLPESGRTFDLSGCHREYMDIGNNFEKFWCVFDGEAITGTVALMYRKAGFVMTERYNNNENADVFMKLSI